MSNSPRVLIACECSQVECLAFRSVGCQAFSCDIQSCYGGHPEWHIQADVRTVCLDNWDIIIAHPPCTYLTAAGANSMFFSPGRCLRPGNINEERFRLMLDARTCFWLRGLPPLLPTHAHDGHQGSWLLHCASSMNRRSRSFEGLAMAMATQWGSLFL